MSKKGAKAQPQNKEQSYDIRDVVLAKVRGFPPWPGMVSLSPLLLAFPPPARVKPLSDRSPLPLPTRRLSTPTPSPRLSRRSDQTRRRKRATGIAFASSPPVTSESPCLSLVHAAVFTIAASLLYSAWIVPKDISRLQQHEIQAYIAEPFKRSGDLLKGYRIALDPKAWEEEKEAAAAEAREEEANAEVDQLESDAEEEPEDDEDKKKKTKKRKRDSDAAPAKSKAKAKKASAEPASKSKTTSAKGKKNGPKSKAMVESEDEGGAEAENESVSKRTSPPPTKKAKRDKEEDADCEFASSPLASVSH